MFCTNCGIKIDQTDKFCTQCGSSLEEIKEVQSVRVVETDSGNPTAVSNDKWWVRFLRVGYYFLCLQILWIVPAVWSSNSRSYVGYYYGNGGYEDTPGTAFWYSLLTIVIYMIVLRLLKIAVLYIVTGKKPAWGREFRKLY